MANEEHLNILNSGVELWNEWRRVNHQIINPDLSGANLERSDLAGANLRAANLAGANLRGANLAGADLRFADLGHAQLSGADLTNADLGGAFLNSAELVGADLTAANLNSANHRPASMLNANFTGSNLSFANLTNSLLSGARFTGSNLTGTAFDAAVFYKNTDLSDCTLWSTSFGRVDLSEVTGLETVTHNGPSSIGIDTLFMSKGKISEQFLRGCGVPDTFITYIPDLIASIAPIQFYKCFISFTETDDAFVEKLYNDLIARGVNCWRWKENARWGANLMRSIDQAIQAFDKVMVVCSEQSLQAPVVLREIERALQKEDELTRQGKDSDVLFPVRLDDYVLNEWDHHRKADVNEKYIGDFRQWRDPAKYSEGLDRLIRDLQT